MNDSFVLGHLCPDELACDDEARTAAVVNGPLVASQWLRYTRPEDTAVFAFRLTSSNGDYVFEVGPGKYLSAIMMEWVVIGSIVQVCDIPKAKGFYCGLSVVSDWSRYEVKVFVEKYMGERICLEARDEASEKHEFLKKLLGLLDRGEDFRLEVHYEPSL